MDSRDLDRSVFNLSPTLGGVHLVGFYLEEIAGDEESRLDDFLQTLTVQGNYVLESSIVVDAECDPPVSGWVLYKETAT